MTAPAVKLRMDRGKAFSSVHGERAPNDPHAKVMFYQDGLPFDSNGIYVEGLVTDARLLAVAERKLKKLAKASGSKDADSPAADSVSGLPADDGDEDDDDDKPLTPGNPGADDVNLESWLRGEAQYQWFSISAAISKRFGRRVTGVADAVLLLVAEEKIVAADQVAAPLKQHLA